MDKGPERVRVWRLWHWFSSPGRVPRTRPGELNPNPNPACACPGIEKIPGKPRIQPLKNSVM